MARRSFPWEGPGKVAICRSGAALLPPGGRLRSPSSFAKTTRHAHHVYPDFMPQYSAKRAPWYELRSFNMPLVIISVLLFISVLITTPVQAIINRRRGARLRPASRTARWILVAISLLNLVFLCGMLFGYHPPTELHGVAPAIKLLLATTVMSALLTAAGLVYIVLAWKNRSWGSPSACTTPSSRPPPSVSCGSSTNGTY